MPTITTEEWLKALEEARRQSPEIEGDGLTVRELSAQFGINDRAMTRNLQVMIKSGRVISKRGRRIAIDGIMRAVPTYILKGEGGKP